MYGLAVQCHLTFDAMTAKTIRTWNKNHMPFPELGCVARPQGKVAFHAHCTG
jgi:hypothetical protein